MKLHKCWLVVGWLWDGCGLVVGWFKVRGVKDLGLGLLYNSIIDFHNSIMLLFILYYFTYILHILFYYSLKKLNYFSALFVWYYWIGLFYVIIYDLICDFVILILCF